MSKNQRRRLTRLLAIGLLAAVALTPGAARADAAAPVKAKVRKGTLIVTGNAAANRLALRLRAGAPAILEVDVGDDGSAELDFDRARFERIVVDARAGDDLVRIDESNGGFTDTEAATLNGDEGDDTLLGGAGAEVLDGGAGTDSADGNGGADVAVLGDGDDRFVWDPGDGSDRVEGEAGRDTMLFNGSGPPELFELTANGERLRFFRNLGGIVMDVAGVERVELKARAGGDEVLVDDLSPTDVRELDLALADQVGDGDEDRVELAGAVTGEAVEMAGGVGSLTVSGLPALVTVANASNLDGVNDTLAIRTGAGDDRVDARQLPAEAIRLELDGGAGNDTLLDGDGFSALLAGDGDDLVDGGGGVDSAALGDGDDRYVLEPGDGANLIDGEGGSDRISVGPTGFVELSASSGSVLVDGFNEASVVNGVEIADIQSLHVGSAIVDDLAGTGLTQVNVNRTGTPGAAAARPVNGVVVNGTAADDTVRIAAENGEVAVSGLAATVRILNPDGSDLLVNGLAGADTITAATGLADLVKLLLGGGEGADTLTGGDGDDELEGGADNDTLSGNSGNDVLAGGPGTDVLDSGPGADQLSCGAAGDTLLTDAEDTIAPDCVMA